MLLFKFLDAKESTDLEEINDSLLEHKLLFFWVNDLQNFQKCVSVRFLLVIEIQYFSEELASLSNRQISFVFFIINVVKLHDAFDSFSNTPCRLLLNSIFVVVENDTQEYIDQEEPAEEKENDEKEWISPISVVRKEHHIRKVGSCDKKQQVVVAISKRVKCSISFECSLVEVHAESGEVKYGDDDT